MSGWEPLVAAALVGTDRRPLGRSNAAGPLGEALAGLGEQPDLLSVAAMRWAYEHAGQSPALGAAPDAPGDLGPTAGPGPDDRAPLPEPAVRALVAILETAQFRPLLGEWLTLAAQRGGRVPPDVVPAILDGARGPGRDPARVVVGALGRWLAEQNPAWAWVIESGPGRKASGAAGPPDEAGARALAGSAPATIAQFATTQPGPWSPAVTTAVLAEVARVIVSEPPVRARPLRDALPRLALVVDPLAAETAPALNDVVEELPDRQRMAARAYWARPLAGFSALIHFRRAMARELR